MEKGRSQKAFKGEVILKDLVVQTWGDVKKAIAQLDQHLDEEQQLDWMLVGFGDTHVSVCNVGDEKIRIISYTKEEQLQKRKR